jgi:hypothetical protein
MPQPWPLMAIPVLPIQLSMSCLFAQSVKAGHEVLARLYFGQLLLLRLPIIQLRNLPLLTVYGTVPLADESGSKLLYQFFLLRCLVESHSLVLLL